jgi:tRNA G10  N-methylase Trm11
MVSITDVDGAADHRLASVLVELAETDDTFLQAANEVDLRENAVLAIATGEHYGVITKLHEASDLLVKIGEGSIVTHHVV